MRLTTPGVHDSPPVVLRRAIAVIGLFAAACGKARRESAAEILERGEMRDAWLAVLAPVLLAVLLLFVLLVLRQRREPKTAVPGLFQPYNLADLRRWWRERVAAYRRARERARAREAAAQALRAQQLAEQPPGPTIRPPDLPPAPFPWNMSVAVCAAVSIALLLATGFWVAVHDVGRETRSPLEPLIAFGPHAMVLVAAVFGFRNTANVIAIFAALGWSAIFGFLTLLSMGTVPQVLILGLLQIVLLVSAILDLSRGLRTPGQK